MEDFILKEGLKGTASAFVSEDNTALKYGSGTVKVFSTPAMIGLMEKAAILAVDKLLPEGMATVGTKIEVRHLAATPLKMGVTANAVLEEVDGKKLKFRIEAFDEVEKIGEGSHSRYIIKLDDFISKTEEKIKK